MLNFERNRINSFVCTLSELVTLDDVHYLFTFIDEMSNKRYNIVLADLSLHKERYNLFELDVPAQIDFDYNGFYRYEVREQDNSVNLDPSLSGALIETGRMRLIGDRIAEQAFTQTNENEQYTRE